MFDYSNLASKFGNLFENFIIIIFGLKTALKLGQELKSTEYKKLVLNALQFTF